MVSSLASESSGTPSVPSKGLGGTASTTTGTITAIDIAGNRQDYSYTLNPAIGDPSTQEFTFDANGNMTSDGTRTFEWDAENRLIAVEQGTQRSEFSCDGVSRRVAVIEKSGENVLSSLHYVWCNVEICDERSLSGSSPPSRTSRVAATLGPSERSGAALTDHSQSRLRFAGWPMQSVLPLPHGTLVEAQEGSESVLAEAQSLTAGPETLWKGSLGVIGSVADESEDSRDESNDGGPLVVFPVPDRGRMDAKLLGQVSLAESEL